MTKTHRADTTSPPEPSVPPDALLLSATLPPNTSCLLVHKRTVRIEPIPLPLPLAPDGVLVRVMANGICGSDMHAYLAGGVGGRPVLTPTVMGHEAAGIVEAVGADVTTHCPGDRVAVEPGLPCRRCTNCKSGRSNICLHIRYCGAPGNHGTLSRFVALPADMAPHIPDAVTWDVAGCIQPLAIGVQIGKRADLRAHQTVAIFGCGPIGLITAAVAHAYSARRIIAFDIRPSRVSFAKTYMSPLTGRPIIDHVVHIEDICVEANGDAPDSPPSDDAHGDANGDANGDVNGDTNGNDPGLHLTLGDRMYECAQRHMADIMRQYGFPHGVDRVVEASGAQDAMMHGVALCKEGGVFLQVGLGPVQTHLFPTIAVTNKELDVRGITRYTPSCFPDAIDMLDRGVVDLGPLITARFPLSHAEDAFQAVASGREIKVIIQNQK